MTKTFNELLESVHVGDTVTGFLKADLETILHQELQKTRSEGYEQGYNQGKFDEKMDAEYKHLEEQQKAREEERKRIEQAHMAGYYSCCNRDASYSEARNYFDSLNHSELDQPTEKDKQKEEAVAGLVLTEMYLTIEKGEAKAERRLTAKQAKSFFYDKEQYERYVQWFNEQEALINGIKLE